jgi:glycosyltransferase involved in cell wall biosynthesis
MKVLYDHQIFSTQIYGGISRYFIELMKNIENDNGIKYDLSLRYSNNHYLNEYNDLKYKPFFKNFTFRGKYRLINILNKNISKKLLIKRDYDIFHPTYYDPYFLNILNNKPLVLTIYDMIHEIYPEMFSSKDETSKRKKLLAQKATKIIAISENTKKDIIRFFNIDEKKIEVIYLANSINPSKSIDDINIDLPKKYILFVGSRSIYKNFNLFIEAISPLLIEDIELNVVCVGGGNFKEMEKEKFKKLNIINKIFQYAANDYILAYLYQKAIAFVFPSLYEGFGIPILEAFSCGCPVIASDASSLPEVAGDAAIYFNPKDKLSILDSIQQVIYKKDLRKQLLNKGYQRIKQFTWKKTAHQTKKLYEGIL